MLYISVVSHGHLQILKDLNCLPKLGRLGNVSITVLDNLGEDSLKDWCFLNNIIYLKNSIPKGFGENNNFIFKYNKKELGMNKDDRFLVLNPDVSIPPLGITKLLEVQDAFKAPIASINLFKDDQFKVHDHSIRKFPRPWDFFTSFMFNINKSVINKLGIESPVYVDWAAGSFLCFDVSHYEKLNGFDENYFMYCEDLDICYRSYKYFNQKVLYIPQIEALHLAKHENKKIFTSHFYWHLSSILKYLKKVYIKW